MKNTKEDKEKTMETQTKELFLCNRCLLFDMCLQL
jgi:hypothetical protein